MYCLYVAENMTKCLLTRGVPLREVSVSGGSIVYAKTEIVKKNLSSAWEEWRFHFFLKCRSELSTNIADADTLQALMD